MPAGAVAQQVDLLQIRGELPRLAELGHVVDGIRDIIEGLRPAAGAVAAVDPAVGGHPHGHAPARQVPCQIGHIRGVGGVVPGAAVQHHDHGMSGARGPVAPGLRVGHEQPAGLALVIRAPGVAAAVHGPARGLAIRGVPPLLRALLAHGRGDARPHADGQGQTSSSLQQAATSDRPRRCGPLGALLEPTALLLCCQLARLSPGSRFGARLLRAVHDPRTTGRRARSSVSRPHSDQEPS